MATLKFYRGLQANYAAETTHKDGVYFATDTAEILMNGVSYGFTKAINNVAFENNTFTFSFNDGSEATIIALANATTTTAGLMSAEDKAKLDSLASEIEAMLVYTPTVDESLKTLNTLGGIAAGTTAGSLKGKSFSQMFDDLLFPTVQPTFTAPSATLKLTNTTTTPTVQEVGTTGSSVPTADSFTTGFNKGAININGVKKQDRAGELDTENSFIYIGSATNTTFPTSITEGSTTYKYRAAYSAGPTPLDSKGNTATSGNALVAGYVDSAAVTITGVYPYYTNSVNNEAFAKLALTTATKLEVTFVAEGPNKHTFKLPAKYTLSNVRALNTLSNQYEAFGTSKFDVTTETISVQGSDVSYKVYTRNDSGFSGETKFEISFTK